MKKIYFLIIAALFSCQGKAMDNGQSIYFDMKGNFLIEKFISSVAASSEKEEFVNGFLKYIEDGKYPLFTNDSSYVLLYRSSGDSVGVTGDMSNWAYSIPMKKIEGTDLFYLNGKAEADARFEYWIMAAGKSGIPSLDLLNPYKGLSGFGEVSELAMPLYRRHPYFEKFIHGMKGDAGELKVHQIASKALGYEHTVHVYLPPDYDPAAKYPAVYFQDGIDYVEFAQVPAALDSLIKNGNIRPVIAVFVTPPNRLKAGAPNRMTEYGLNDDYVKFITDELVPFIDSSYKTLNVPEMRLVAGDSFGGLISAYIPFTRPDVFANGYSQSGYHSFNKDRQINLFRTHERKPVKLYVDTGIYERSVGLSFLPKDETDFLMGNRRFEQVLKEKNYTHVYREYPEGHTWGNWKRHLLDAMVYFFPGNRESGR